jgi:hypothetical protein
VVLIDWCGHIDKPFYQITSQSIEICAISSVGFKWHRVLQDIVLERIHAGYPDDFFVAFACSIL